MHSLGFDQVRTTAILTRSRNRGAATIHLGRRKLPVRDGLHWMCMTIVAIVWQRHALHVPIVGSHCDHCYLYVSIYTYVSYRRTKTAASL